MGINAQKVVKSFGKPAHAVLHGLSFSIDDGEFVSISGRSGSGKTTLLYLISTLDAPTSGNVKIDDEDTAEMSVSRVHEFRNLYIGFIFQFHYLLPELTAVENILLPARKTRRHSAFEDRAIHLMDEFGLQGKYDRLPGQLSGGEQQRVAIARALIMNPRYIFADEPTGNLDSVSGLNVMRLLKRVNEENKTTIVLVTHEPDYAAMTSRQINLVDGRIV